MNENYRFWLVLVAAVVLVVLLLGGSGGDGPPLDPRSVNPDGAKGIVESLERAGAQVDLDEAVPERDASTALLLQDRLTEEDSDAITGWIEQGGVLVVADLSSSFAARRVGRFSAAPAGGATQRRGVCTIEALAEANELEVGGSLLEVSNAGSCFGDGSAAFIVAEAVGDGNIVTIGNPNMFTNAELDEADAAVVALTLLVPDRETAHVAFIGPSVVDFGDEGLTDLVPPRVTNAIWQLMAAFLLYALFRSRRLGRVVPEPVPVRIEGSELVLKSGLLSERAKDPSSAANLLRSDFVARTRRSLSIVPADGADAVARRVAERLDVPVDEVHAALTAPVVSEADLINVSRTLSDYDFGLLETTTTNSTRK